MANLKKLLLFSQSLFLIPSVFAAEVPAFSDFISNLGDYLWGWMTNSYSVYFFTFVFFFILLYGIYSAALRFVKIFQENNGLNRSGKLVGVSLSLLSCLAIFFFTKEKCIYITHNTSFVVLPLFPTNPNSTQLKNQKTQSKKSQIV